MHTHWIGTKQSICRALALKTSLWLHLGLQQYWGALERGLLLCLLACWLPHLGTLELCSRLYLGPLTCWQQYQLKQLAALQVGSPAKPASWQGCRSAGSDIAEPADTSSIKTKRTGSRARNSRAPGRHKRAQHWVLWQAWCHRQQRQPWWVISQDGCRNVGVLILDLF